MINFNKTKGTVIEKMDKYSAGCWVNVVAPEPREIDYLINELKIDPGFIYSSLDEEESPRIESEDDQTLVIVDIPIINKEKTDTTMYTTMPIGIILTQHNVVTVCLKPTQLIDDFENGAMRNVQTHLKTRFLLNILLKTASQYLFFLKQIDRRSSDLEALLHRSMKNKELIQLLGLEKSLVYFSTSLKSNEITLEKILRGRIIKMYEDDQELLEDVLIEIKQAIDMSNIYSSILSGTMDAFASIISNNLNIVMKILTSITILMAIPTMIFSFYGMNVDGLLLEQFSWFPLAIAGVLTAIAAVVLIKTNMFK